MHRPSLPNSNCGSTHAPSESWGDPDMSVVNLVRVLAPRMPLRGFGDALSNYIEIAAEAASAPADYVGLSLLSGFQGGGFDLFPERVDFVAGCGIFLGAGFARRHRCHERHALSDRCIRNGHYV